MLRGMPKKRLNFQDGEDSLVGTLAITNAMHIDGEQVNVEKENKVDDNANKKRHKKDDGTGRDFW
jgi:hypothetical protein